MRPPYVHEHLTCVAAPATWLSPPSGTLSGGADGLYVEDRRVLSHWRVTVDGAEPAVSEAYRTGAASARCSAVLHDAALTLRRDRLAEPTGGTEIITLTNAASEPRTVTVRVRAATDFAPLGLVRAGGVAQVTGTVSPELEWRSADGMSVRIEATPPPAVTTAGAEATLQWRAVVPPGAGWSAELRVTRTDIPPIARPKRFSTLRVAAEDHRLDALVRTGVQDLDALRRTEGAHVYYAAGSPWFLTLFGRDALWSARLALPLGHDVAAGTLRALADRQGTADDPATEEQPGRILHELRRADSAPSFPPTYYGTVDATPLFVSTLAEAYRWGMPAAAVRALLPNVRRALAWLRRHDGFITHSTGGPGLSNQGWKDSAEAIQHADGRAARGPIALSEVQAYAYRAALDGAWLLEQLSDGATPRPALSGLAVSSGRSGAAEALAGLTGLAGLDAWLAEEAGGGSDPARPAALDADGAGGAAGADVAGAGGAAGAGVAGAGGAGAGGGGGAGVASAGGGGGAGAGGSGAESAADEAQRWRAWADDLSARFRAAFWCPGGHPAIALDGDGHPVDLVASNMGHLLGTGLLTPEESATVAGHLAGLRSPFGIRTASPASAGYDPLAYHLGSVWPHDNAIALLGLAHDGHRAEASAVITALLAAAERFEYRLPELYGGDERPTPYPFACRPQAWAAAAAPAILIALLGLDVDVPAGRVTFAPLAPSPVGAYRVRGLKIADGELDVSVTAAGELTVHNGPVGVTFHNADGSPARIARPT
ncbi:glycogen debranching N-terminal domain-containing protein [Dactylosporangium sp. CA-052675]|uniref:glycogen debranching N-terminal domain-containing protein n=1 Tax=Dactylosporangium sp. CA-052675 TaxID=3239927 RepID=UPI003D89E1A5